MQLYNCINKVFIENNVGCSIRQSFGILVFKAVYIPLEKRAYEDFAMYVVHIS